MLTRRIFLYSSALLLTLIVIITAAFSFFVIRHHRLHAQLLYHTVSRIMAGGIHRLILWDDRVAINELIRHEMHAHSLIEYVFITRNNKIYLSTLDGPTPADLLRTTKHPSPDNELHYFTFKNENGDIFYDLATPIGDTDAILHIGMQREMIDKASFPTLTAFGLISLAVLLVGLFLASKFASLATLEITLLTKAINSYIESEDDIPATEDIGNIKDISWLTKAFTTLVSERTRHKMALKHSHDLMRYIIEHNRSSIAVLDNELKYLFVSRSYIDEFSLHDPNIIGKYLSDVLPDLSVKWMNFYKQALEGQIHNAEEDTYLRGDGSTGWALWECHPWHQADGSIGGIIIYTEIITERKRAELALKESEEHYRQLFDQTNEGLFIMDENWNLIEVNQAFADILGYTVHELKQMNLDDLEVDNSETTSIHRRKSVEQLRKGEVLRFEASHFHKDGHIVDLSVTVSIIQLGNKHYYLAFHQDITDRKRIENQLQQTQKLESIGTLAGGIAHDFNNLLTPIMGLSEILMEDLPEGSAEYTNIVEIHAAAKRAVKLVQQILTFSRKNPHQKIPVEIRAVLAEVIQLARATIPTNIEIVSFLHEDCGIILADPIQIHQVAMNLITNAYHAVEENGGTITIQLQEGRLSDHDKNTLTATTSDNYAIITVSDTGIGIAPAIQKRIFEPYFTTKKQGKGTGIGLSVAYGIIKAHDGTIQIESNPGKGTTFRVALPLVEFKEEAATENTSHIYQTGCEHILLIDDEQAIIKLEKQMLEKLGYRVTPQTSSTKALELFRNQAQDFDLVITDLSMPTITGRQLADEFLAIRKDIPVIICTGFYEKLDEEELHAWGIKGLLFKPVSKGEMANMVRDVLDKQLDN